ncbi:MarC family protein [Leeia sp.]|uniref:MarC family protein n=1 Tax=Leeia sp. TaxID=2884678 RepID=UPI0035AD975A
MNRFNPHAYVFVLDSLKTFVALLALVNPFGAIPFFVSLTTQQNEREKRRTIKIAAVTVAMVIIVSALLGRSIIAFFGISVASFQVGGGLIMLLMSISMLNAQMGGSRTTPEETSEAELRHSIAVVPLAIPLLTGPGTISTVIVYAQKADHWYQYLGLIGSGVAIGILTWVAFKLATPITRVVGRTGINVATRLMGLILAALAVEFIAEGLLTLLPGLRG